MLSIQGIAKFVHLNDSKWFCFYVEEFFIDTLFNLTTTVEVLSECDSYTKNLPANYYINTVLQNKGDCRCG